MLKVPILECWSALPTLPKIGLALVPPLHHVLHVQVVVGVGRLEPGAAVVQVQVHRIGWREAVVHAIEDVLLVALVVEDGKLRRIEKAAGVQAVGLDEVAPVLAAIGEVEAAGRRPEGAVGAVDVAGRLGDALPGARGGHNDQAGLVAVFGRRRAADDLDGLNRVGRGAGWRRPCSAGR